MSAENKTRINEWFVPKFGPMRFRVFVGLLFLPYTGMCVSFAIIGSMLASEVAWDRLGAIALIYILALGISAHIADSLGSKKTKPWGSYFSKTQLLIIMGASLTAAYAIGIYYIVYFVPLLSIIAVLEGFFLFTYNYETWRGIFHNDFWFAVSWGSLPLLAGYIIQTNSISILALAVAGLTGLTSYAEIRMSRPYKRLKQRNSNDTLAGRLEIGLKILSVGTILFALSILAFRIIFS
jgi:small-conductance mechanosensitive channel